MTFVLILLKSILIGGLVGFAAGMGAARMFNAPNVQALGAFRTLGEMNACEGDPASHFSFGLGFFFNAWASTVGAGAFTQDITHRVIPNWAASALLVRNKKIEETMHDPKKMAFTSALIGIVVVVFLNTTASAIPKSLQITAVKVLVPAAELLINIVMPIIFWLAAIDAGKRSGLWATVFGGLSAMIMGNAVPGVVLGILIGKGVDELGWIRLTKIMFTVIIVLFVLSAFFRGFDVQMIESFKLPVPNWLDSLHGLFNVK
ncbi:DUF4311 domain-containing protein [Companilactobacillus keshanensis]|uniref:DUF4311 domain-containing protein n=1 Tax=Companilactobacillus keshanensis TaxID=2486003 RepID=A0ABW4BVT5_9LACO|nr:DUF4311 domain-containing protein [Companilactobacillus keshanensis]